MTGSYQAFISLMVKKKKQLESVATSFHQKHPYEEKLDKISTATVFTGVCMVKDVAFLR